MALSRLRSGSSSLLANLLRSSARPFSAAASPSTKTAVTYSPCSYILAPDKLPGATKPGEAVVMNVEDDRASMLEQTFTLDLSSQIGSCMPISMMRIGTMIHNIEMNPGQGGKLVRAAGTSAKILKEPRAAKFCLIRMPSGKEKLIDTRCRATIGTVSNPSHGAKKLRKAGQSRWLGRRPVVRGVAMNPIDHPHGGGEGKSKSSGSHGKTSSTPWGKPTKSGYKTGPLKRRK